MASLIRRYYFATDSNGRRVRRPSPRWYGQYTDATGRVRRVPLSANKVAAQQMLNELVRKAELAKVGIIDPFEEHSKRPLSEHVRDWETVLRGRGNCEAYVRLKLSRLRRILDGCRFRLLSDLSASRVEAVLAEWARGSPHFGARTYNHYLGAVKEFSRWLLRDRRMGLDPMAYLRGRNVQVDRRHVRRELSDGELVELLRATRCAAPFRGLSGEDRAMLYLVAVSTGLRASELAGLTAASFGLDADPPTLTVKACYSKHRREDVLPLHPDLAAQLRLWLAGRPVEGPLWPGNWASGKEAGVLLARDMAVARAAWVAAGEDRDARQSSDFLMHRDSEGRVADFHSLRHTFCSRLVRAGVHPKAAQTLARHASISLTMDHYTHLGLLDVAASVGQMPLPGQVEGTALPATGTDPGACIAACTNLAPNPDSGRSRVTTDERQGGRRTGPTALPQAVGLTPVDSDCSDLREVEKVTGRSRGGKAPAALPTGPPRRTAGLIFVEGRPAVEAGAWSGDHAPTSGKRSSN